MQVNGRHSWPCSPLLIDASFLPFSNAAYDIEPATLFPDRIASYAAYGRKRKRSPSGTLGIQLGHDAFDGLPATASWHQRPVRSGFRIQHVASYDSWLLVATPDRVAVTHSLADRSSLDDNPSDNALFTETLYFWQPADISKAQGWEITGSPQGFRRTRDCFEVIVSYRARKSRAERSDHPDLVSYHVAFEPAPTVLRKITGSSHPLAFNGKWICFEQRSAVRDVHVYRAQDGLIVPLCSEVTYGNVGASFARRAQSMLVFSTINDELRVFSTTKFEDPLQGIRQPRECQAIGKIGYIPSAIKVAQGASSGPVLIDRTGSHIALFSQLHTAPDSGQLEHPSPAGWAKIIIDRDHYIGDAVILPGGTQLAYLVHHRLGMLPSRIEIVGLPAFPNPEDLPADLPECKPSTTAYESEPGEGNVVLHCDTLVVLHSTPSQSIAFLVGQRSSSSWFRIDYCSNDQMDAFPIPTPPIQMQDVESDNQLLRLIEEGKHREIKRMMRSLLESFKTMYDWGYTLGCTKLPEQEEWDEWTTGMSVNAFTSELLLWPTGALVALRVFFGITLPVDVAAARTDGATSDFVFVAMVDEKPLYLALHINREYTARANDQYQLRRSTQSASDAVRQLLRKLDLKRDMSPHPDLIHRFKALWRDILALRDITGSTPKGQSEGVAKRIQGMVSGSV